MSYDSDVRKGILSFLKQAVNEYENHLTMYEAIAHDLDYEDNDMNYVMGTLSEADKKIKKKFLRYYRESLSTRLLSGE